MTVIVWDGKTLAADRRCCDGSAINTVRKIHRIGNLMVGGAGSMGFINQMIEWVSDGRHPAAFPAAQRDKDDWQVILVIERDGTPSLYDRTPYPTRYEQPHIAIGSGRDFARAALHLHRTAREAVEVAIALDINCGCGIDTLEFQP